MALILKYSYSTLSYILKEFKDPRVEGYYLVENTLPMFGIIGLYLCFVLKWGPKWMENRPAYDLKNVIRVYNAVQVICNLSIFCYGLKNSYLRKEFSIFCMPVDNTNNAPYMTELLRATWLYYITKYLDLLDTVFFVLRKKNKQITFLHVYHHAGMVFAVCIFLKFLGGSHSTMLGVVNVFIHFLMYMYYFASSIYPDYGKSLWWKRYITQLQMAQFGYLIFHYAIVIINNSCGHPNFVAFIGLIQNLFMFVMFFDFYRRAYLHKKIKIN